MKIDHMTAEVKKRGGAPRGNQNARKHGFYSKVLNEVERLDFELATGVEGIDDEIAFTLNPQTVISMMRLKDRLNDAGFGGIWLAELDYIIRLRSYSMIWRNTVSG